ncbi:MAG: monofunctional biosynthetic peptidoglycan transglycosylase [Ferruginibacter sp.]
MKVWSFTKKIFFWIFIAHICWFLFFMFQKFNVKDFAIENLKIKMLVFFCIVLTFGLLYYFLFRKIGSVKKVAIVLREIFFIGYIGMLLYLLWGIVFNPPITLTQMGSLFQGNGLHRDYISYKEMGPNIKLAVIASEDQQFPDHDGFDIRAIKLAMKYNKRHPDKVRGASTISQQVAKNYFLWQGRSQLRKGLEVFFTFNIEELWGKKTILARYLNIAEMGKGVFGVQAAAKSFFNKDAKDLSRMEAAMIAASLPNPKVYTVKPLSSYVSGRAVNILRQMNNLESDPDIQELIK